MGTTEPSAEPTATSVSAWVAFRPDWRLNRRRFVAVPIGAALGAGLTVATSTVYHAEAPFPELVGAAAALWVWMQACVGPLCLTDLYADSSWVGERGLWKRRGMNADHLVYVIRARGTVLVGHPSGIPQRSGDARYFFVLPRLRWSREQTAALANFLGAPTYGIWQKASHQQNLPDLARDPAPVPHLRSVEEIGCAMSVRS